MHDSTGDIYVVDGDRNTVDKFDSSGAAAAFTTAQLPPGTTALDGSNTPDLSFNLFAEADVAVDNTGTSSDGNIYVDSEFFNTIYAFDATGSSLFQISGLNDPCGVAVDTTGHLWISEFNPAIVSQYTAAGVPTGTSIFTGGQGSPCHIAFDSNDNLYVNFFSGGVQRYDTAGNPVGDPIDPGPAFAVAVDRSNDHVYVDRGTDVAEYDENGAAVSRIGSGTLANSIGVAVDSSTGNGRSGDVVVTDAGNLLADIFGPVRALHLPDVTTGVASDIGPTSARVGGIFNAGGLTATCEFEYGETTSYGTTAACSPVPGSGAGDVSVHADLAGLTPGTTYHYRLNGTSADGTASGLDQTFTTPQAPTVGGGTATPGSTSATLKASVNPQGTATAYHFEYGTTTAYGADAPVPDASAGASTGDQSVSVDVDGLQPDTTYHFRVVATNVAGTTAGGDHTFTTRDAPAGDSCPNAAVRQQQGASMLPECRAWELVTQADKGLSPLRIASAPTADGNHVMYDLLGGAPGTSSGAFPKLYATRGTSGWSSSPMLPPAPQLLAQNYQFAALAADLSAYVANAFDGLGATTGAPDVTVLRIDNQGHQTVLHRFPTFFGTSGVDLAASDDLQHVYASVPEALDASHQPGTFNLYDLGSGTPELVGTMPSTDVAPTCGLPHPGTFTQTGFVIGGAIVSEHWTSTDGQRVFFQSRGDDAPACDDPLELYTHDRASGRSTLISGPPVGGDPDNGVDRFLQAAPDGSVALLRTATSLTADDDTDGSASDMDVYRWSASGNAVECITCAIPQAEVLNPTLVSDDGSHVYFSSVAQFDGAPAGATSSRPNLYVWRGGSVHFIAQANGVSDSLLDSNRPAQATPDGRFLLFSGDTADLNGRSGSENGGALQYYRYDDHSGALSCISCPSGGAPATTSVAAPLGSNFWALRGRVRAIADDGATIVFGTTAALIPQDRNGALDLYEWHDGSVGLVTSGTASRTRAQLVSLSPSGHDILFSEIALLTADSQDGAIKLFDARIGGGFPVATPPTSCSADQCRGAVRAPPVLADPSTDAAEGDGNVKPAKRARFSLAALGARQRALFARTGRLSLHVHVNKAGSVSATARARIGPRLQTVAHASKRARGAGAVTLRLRLSKAARRRLADGRPLRVTLVVRFAGAPAKRATLTLLPATANAR